MDFGKKDNKKKDRMSREEAFEIIENWVEETQSRVYGEALEELQDELYIAVQYERLKMDESEKRKFIYVLEEPIEKKDGSEAISMFHISKRKQSEVFEMEKFKTKSAQTEKLMQTYCKDSQGEDITIGFISRIDPRDSNVIQAVISTFFL
jgi:hypothetical protein